MFDLLPPARPSSLCGFIGFKAAWDARFCNLRRGITGITNFSFGYYCIFCEHLFLYSPNLS